MNSYLSKSARESIENSVFGDSHQALKPHRRTLTVMFTDIANFTAMSESLQSEMLITHLKVYIAILTSIIYQYNGEIDKFLGDGLLAYFEDARCALLASCEIQVMLNNFNHRQEEQLQPRFDTRIGLATGMVLQASLGFDERREITILGDRVNTAARLQASAPIGGILLDELTYCNAGKPEYSEMESYILKGKQQTEVTYMVEYELALKLL
jgi:adenylate cyclase